MNEQRARGDAPSQGRRGRESRRAARLASAASAPAGNLKRRIPTYDLLGEEDLLRIEDAAETILQEIGIEFRNDASALALWRDAGADIDGERVRLPRGLARKLCGTAPREFTQLARNPERNVVMGGDNVIFAPAYGSPFVQDMDEGRRYGSLEDFRNFVRLAYLSPNIHHSGGTVCEPVDIPVSKRHLDMVLAHLTFSDKPLLGGVTGPDRATDCIDMCRIVFGAETTERDCVILGNVNVNSPLVYDGTVTMVMRAYAAANQGVIVTPFILGGAMGPVTNAGAIAQAHAETMAGIAFTQLVRPGAPAVYGNFLSSMALRSGAPTFGTPEPALGSLVVGQLARRLGLPLRCSGAFTTSKATDAQAMNESAMSMLAAIHCGANYILHSAGWLEGGLSMGYEKFMLDADFLGSLAVYLGGLRVDDATLALDAFREVGPGYHFFGCAHTMAHFETAFWDSALSDNLSFEQWRDGGGWDAEMRANAAWRKALADYAPPPIDPATAEALDAFVAKRKESLPDAWY